MLGRTESGGRHLSLKLSTYRLAVVYEAIIEELLRLPNGCAFFCEMRLSHRLGARILRKSRLFLCSI